MKNILTKIPTFIYSLVVICCLLISLVSYILGHLEPENTSSKILFSLAITLTSTMTIPTVKILFVIFEEEYPEDLRVKFRNFFAENLLFSLFLGILMLLKTYGFFNFMTFLALILIFIGVSFSYKKLRKPRRIRRI